MRELNIVLWLFSLMIVTGFGVAFLAGLSIHPGKEPIFFFTFFPAMAVLVYHSFWRIVYEYPVKN